jgi:cleavage and polyadenylation specificity factor subunit 3
MSIHMMSTSAGPMAASVTPGQAATDFDQDRMLFRPLGAGQEVGRSCHVLEFKEKRILLDCGIHPGLTGN